MKIAILGYGMEGRASYQYWSQMGGHDITVLDQKTPEILPPAEAKTVFGENYLDNLDEFDLVVRTASFNKYEIKTTAKVWTATNEFFAKCPAKIIGVTGTKGKGTTASLIDSLFRKAGYKTWLTGNIGIVSLMDLENIKPTDIVIYELSSFQLWDLEKSPHVSVVTIIEPEHLDVHRNFDDYILAKANIRRFQTVEDICFYHPSNIYSERIAKITRVGRISHYGVAGDKQSVYEKAGYFWCDDQKICPTSQLQLVGQHNIENACAALSVAKFYGLSDEQISEGLEDFKGLPHRLEFVRQVKGVSYYNDSFSSSTPAVGAAIRAFRQPEVLILGGIDRGGDFSKIANVVEEANNIKAIIVMGEIRHKLANLIKETKTSARVVVTDKKTMAGVFAEAQVLVSPGDVMILSPGCASFDMFKDFSDRGNQFKEEVNKL